MLSKLPHHRKGLILISLTAFLWSSSGLFIKILSIDAFQILFYRSSIAALTIFIVSVIRKKELKFEKDLISNLCAISFAGILILFVTANKLTTSANAIFLQFTVPIYLLFLEPVFLKTKFDKKSLVTVAICIAGMVLFFFGKLEIGNIWGNIIAILSGISFAFFSLFLKWKKQLHGKENTINNIIIGNIIVAFFCFPFIYNKLAITQTETWILLYMGVIQIGISYLIFNEGIKYVSATESMIIATLEAIFNPIWVFIGVGETPSVYAVTGGVIILAAILFHNFVLNKTKKV
ncbi:MAG: EamA family transporter [Ignavibacteriae bacterium]|nr:EamA family transporter [Ignavibacteriota bacterium]